MLSMLPMGIDTILGESGSLISGGEKQRIGIARSIYRNSPLIILDEATSSLDKITESIVVSNLLDMKHTTIVAITHNPVSMREFNKVIYFDNGRVDSIGSFQELVSESPKFRKLLRSNSSRD